VEGTQMPRVRSRQMHVLGVPAPEVVPTLGNHGVADVLVLEGVHVPYVHEDVLVDDDVVHDVRASPAAPPAGPDEAHRTPPRNNRLAEAERHPANERERADTHADGRADEG